MFQQETLNNFLIQMKEAKREEFHKRISRDKREEIFKQKRLLSQQQANNEDQFSKHLICQTSIIYKQDYEKALENVQNEVQYFSQTEFLTYDIIHLYLRIKKELITSFPLIQTLENSIYLINSISPELDIMCLQLIIKLTEESETCLELINKHSSKLIQLFMTNNNLKSKIITIFSNIAADCQYTRDAILEKDIVRQLFDFEFADSDYLTEFGYFIQNCFFQEPKQIHCKYLEELMNYIISKYSALITTINLAEFLRIDRIILALTQTGINEDQLEVFSILLDIHDPLCRIQLIKIFQYYSVYILNELHKELREAIIYKIIIVTESASGILLENCLNCLQKMISIKTILINFVNNSNIFTNIIAQDWCLQSNQQVFHSINQKKILKFLELALTTMQQSDVEKLCEKQNYQLIRKLISFLSDTEDIDQKIDGYDLLRTMLESIDMEKFKQIFVQEKLEEMLYKLQYHANDTLGEIAIQMLNFFE